MPGHLQRLQVDSGDAVIARHSHVSPRAVGLDQDAFRRTAQSYALNLLTSCCVEHHQIATFEI